MERVGKREKEGWPYPPLRMMFVLKKLVLMIC